MYVNSRRSDRPRNSYDRAAWESAYFVFTEGNGSAQLEAIFCNGQAGVFFYCRDSNIMLSQIYASGPYSYLPFCSFWISVGTPAVCNPIGKTTTTASLTTTTTTRAPITTTTKAPITTTTTSKAPITTIPVNSWIETLRQRAWILLNGLLVTISINDDGSVYGTNNNHDVFFKSASTLTWVLIPGKLRQIDSKSIDLVVGVNQFNEVFQYKPATGFIKIGEGARWASIGSDGEIWMVTQLNKIYRLSNRGWIQVAGDADMISVGNLDNVYIKNSLNEILVYKPISLPFGIKIDRWILLPSTNSINMLLISASANGKLIGVSLQNILYAWNGANWEPASTTLSNVKYISMSSSGAYFAVTDSKQQIYFTKNF